MSTWPQYLFIYIFDKKTYIYIYIHLSIYIYINILKYFDLFIHTYIYIYICIWIYIYICICIFIHIYMYLKYTYMNILMHIYTYTHTYVYTYISIYISRGSHPGVRFHHQPCQPLCWQRRMRRQISLKPTDVNLWTMAPNPATFRVIQKFESFESRKNSRHGHNWSPCSWSHIGGWPTVATPTLGPAAHHPPREITS